jgi:hypothetical protein
MGDYGRVSNRNRLGLTPDLTTRWAIILSVHPCGTSRILLHAVKSDDMGPSGFTSHPKEGVLRIFIALKIHRLGRALNT